MEANFTPGPWFAHGFTYPEGVVGDVFAKDSNNVLTCTAICRVVEPISRMDSDLRRPPVDALRAIACKADARPTIEANARLISSAPDLYAAVEEMLSIWDMGSDPSYAAIDRWRSALDKARGE